MSRRSYDGDALDHSWQYFHERPAAEEDAGETVYVTDPTLDAEETTENVPVPDGGQPSVDGDGQTTFDDWRWSA